MFEQIESKRGTSIPISGASLPGLEFFEYPPTISGTLNYSASQRESGGLVLLRLHVAPSISARGEKRSPLLQPRPDQQKVESDQDEDIPQ
jgi:hypothetical protein